LEALSLLPYDLDRGKCELELQIALAVPTTSVKGYASSEVQHTYTRARELCLQIGETPQLFPPFTACGGFIYYAPNMKPQSC
jgi:predicted ATPase